MDRTLVASRGGAAILTPAYDEHRDGTVQRRRVGIATDVKVASLEQSHSHGGRWSHRRLRTDSD